MLRVVNSKPYKVVYSLCRHEFLGFLIEPHVVQLNPDGDFSLTYQRLFSNTAAEFMEGLDETDFKLIRLLDQTEQSNIIRRFYKKPIRPIEFFTSIYNEQIHKTVRTSIDRKLIEVLSHLGDRPLFLMSKEGWPVERRLSIADEPASVLFHFRRNETETRYFPTIKYQGSRIQFVFRDANIICNEPAWMLLEDVLYYFEGGLEGKKLTPFLNKSHISITKASEHTYFERFVAPLIEKHAVRAEGFTINTEKFFVEPLLQLRYQDQGTSYFILSFIYGKYVFPMDRDNDVSVKLEYLEAEDSYIFHRIKRNVSFEKAVLNRLESLGLLRSPGIFSQLLPPASEDDSYAAVSWLNRHIQDLEDANIRIGQMEQEKKFLFGKSSINMEINESSDWFDLKATVTFGQYSFPFTQLREHILNKIREFALPNGEIAIIPEEWFSQYGNLLDFADKHSEGLRFKRHHIGLLQEYANSELASISMDRKLQQLANFEEIADAEAPQNFRGTLRPYQKAGYNWFMFLKNYRFGGCLADDMGLGKTIQTLAFLQKLKEEAAAQNQRCCSMIVMPTSLIYNWMQEALKFAPDIQVLCYTGSARAKDIERFQDFDLVLTTYGIVRMDVELLEHFYFHYIILDESQNIKNADSKSFKSVKKLKSQHKLILSGTPVENSVNDLWTQMSFVNPGLLGSRKFFQENFASPIEKKKDQEKARKLQAIIKPFVLRRTKDQVARELPDKLEQIFYCSMSEDQAEIYESIKSEYRNELMRSLENGGVQRSSIQILQGLTRLRQIANHPRLIDENYEGFSGKFETVTENLLNVLAEGHKVLVFSQFVRQLELYCKYLDKEGVSYLYLDGATRNRGDIVAEFQKNEEIKLFLISLKAGGVGLNLTEADYVFILDPWWNPAVEQQAVDRTHRIGQQKNVFIYKFITKDSVEEKILSLQNRKRSMAESLITTEESFVKSLSAEDIREILN